MNAEQNRAGYSYHNFLDGWKGIAILCIVLGHFYFLTSFDLSNGPSRFLNNLSYYIAYIVDVFFIISGFFAMESLLRNNGRSPSGFIKKRFLRILPHYFVFVACSMLLLNAIPPVEITKTTLIPPKKHTLTLQRTDRERSKYSFSDRRTGKRYDFEVRRSAGVKFLLVTDKDYNVSSMNFEIDPDSLLSMQEGQTLEYTSGVINHIFTVKTRSRDEKLWPFLLLVQNYFGGNKIKFLEHLWFIAILVHFYVFISVLFFLSRKFFRSPGPSNNFLILVFLACMVVISLLKTGYDARTHLRMDAILLGSLISLVRITYFRNRTYNGPSLVFPLMFITGVVLIVSYIYIFYDYMWHTSIPPTLNYLTFGLAIVGTMRRSFLSGVLIENSLFRFLGRYSYGIYLWHFPFTFITYFYVKKHFALSDSIWIILFMPSSILLGVAVEKGLNKLSRILVRRTVTT